MGIVDHHSVVFVRGGNNLGSSRYLYLEKTFMNGFEGYSHQPADRDSTQGIVHAEKAGNRYLDALPEPGCHGKKLYRIGMGGNILSSHVGRFFYAEGAYLTFRIIQNTVGICCVHINYALLTHGEEAKLGCKIVLHIGMLKPSDMILRKVGKNAIVKLAARHPVKFEPLGGYLQHRRVGPLLLHFLKHLLKIIGFRGGPPGRNLLPAYAVGYCAN